MIKLTVNGGEHSWDGDPSLPLLWYLRDEAGLTGTKFGCGQALCGACTVHVERPGGAVLHHRDGGRRRTRRSSRSRGCTRPATIRCRKPGASCNVPQCGYCQAGQIMQAAALLTENPHPSTEQIRDTMAGNICRCGCYQRIEAAIRLAATGA